MKKHATPDIYVAPYGDDSDPGTPALPRRTMAAATAACPAGGRVVVVRGVYAHG